jgi:hypothetical protein
MAADYGRDHAMRRASRHAISRRGALGLCVLILGTVLGMHSLTNAHFQPTSARPSTAAIDPRLIIHPHATSFRGSLGGGVKLAGTLSPSLLGTNVITLSVQPRDHAPAHGGQVRLTLTMPGMRMSPIQATLAAGAGGYTGRVA